MPDAPETSPAPGDAPAPLGYRALADDRSVESPGRAWAMVRALFYSVVFGSLLALFGSVFVAAVVSDFRGLYLPHAKSWRATVFVVAAVVSDFRGPSMLGTASMLALMAWLTWASVRSVWLLAKRRISYPFESPRDRGPLDPPRVGYGYPSETGSNASRALDP